MKTTEQQHNERKREIMEKCFECYAENGLTGTGIKALADACGCTKANLYSYFKNLDELIIESTAYCMEKVEDDFMEMAPTDPEDVVRFVKEVPYWTAKKHGKKYRLMYQIYTHPKYIEHGKKFFEGVNERYTEYAKRLEPKIGIPYTMLIVSGILMNIPEDLYEAAKIDGASPFVMFTKITMPYVLFVTTPYLITQLVGNINNFNVIYFLTGGTPATLDYYQAGKTDLLVTWLYKLTVNSRDYSYAATIGILVFIICSLLSLITFRRSASYKNEEAFQ
jgi:AcrR family transcriptional regulator